VHRTSAGTSIIVIMLTDHLNGFFAISSRVDFIIIRRGNINKDLPEVVFIPQMELLSCGMRVNPFTEKSFLPVVYLAKLLWRLKGDFKIMIYIS
jgi:hypothetical protein